MLPVSFKYQDSGRLTFDRGSSLYLDGSNHKMSVMGWAGHDERKCSDGRVAEEMALKSCSVVQNRGGLLMKHSNKHNNEIGAFKRNMQIKTNQMI